MIKSQEIDGQTIRFIIWDGKRWVWEDDLNLLIDKTQKQNQDLRALLDIVVQINLPDICDKYKNETGVGLLAKNHLVDVVAKAQALKLALGGK
jgi:hypothetical protein